MGNYHFDEEIFLKTDFEVARDSYDQAKPGGSVQDFNDGYEFATELIEVFKDNSLLDLGTATGTVPMTMRKAGMLAVGLEGCDAPKIRNLGAWKDYPQIIRNADISRPFEIRNQNGEIVKFKFITGWSTFEHIYTDRLDILFENIKKHLKDDGFLIANIDTDGDSERWHKTIRQWYEWREILSKHFFLDEKTLISWDWHFPRPSKEEIEIGKKLNGRLWTAKADKTYWWCMKK